MNSRFLFFLYFSIIQPSEKGHVSFRLVPVRDETVRLLSHKTTVGLQSESLNRRVSLQFNYFWFKFLITESVKKTEEVQKRKGRVWRHGISTSLCWLLLYFETVST